MEKLGSRIRSLRNERGVTQAELGKIIGVGKSTISQYETGASRPDYELLQKLANYFEVSTDYLLGRTDTRHVSYISTANLKHYLREPNTVFLTDTRLTYPTLELADVINNSELQLTAGGQPLTQRQRLNLLRTLENPAFLAGEVKYNYIPILGRIKTDIALLAEENCAGKLEIPSDIHADFALKVKDDSLIGVGLLEGDYALCCKQQTANNGDIVMALHDITEGCLEATLRYYYNDNAPILRAANPDYKDIPLNGNYRIAGVLVAVLRKEAPAYRVYNNYMAARDINKKRWDPVIEKASQLGIKPKELINVLDTMYQVMKGTDK